MNLRSFQMHNFRILHAPQHGTYADEDGIGVSSPADLRAGEHRTIPYTAPDAYGVPVGLGMLFSEGLMAEDHAVRVDVQMEDGSWVEYDPEAQPSVGQPSSHHRPIGREHRPPRKRRERRPARVDGVVQTKARDQASE